MMAWYVATTHHRAELIAETYIREDLIKKRGFELQVLNLKYEETKYVRGCKQTAERPLFPGYLFINFDKACEDWRHVNTARGIREVMSTGPETPTRVRGVIMDEILLRCNSDGVVDAAEVDNTISRYIPVGGSVKVIEGPFAGLVGKVKLSVNDKISVLLGNSILGRHRAIEFKSANLELVA